MKYYEYPSKKKVKETALMFWFFLGLFGGHRFYLHHYHIGALFLLTFGGFGILWIIDGFRLYRMVEYYNRHHARVYLCTCSGKSYGCPVHKNKNQKNVDTKPK